MKRGKKSKAKLAQEHEKFAISIFVLLCSVVLVQSLSLQFDKGKTASVTKFEEKMIAFYHFQESLRTSLGRAHFSMASGEPEYKQGVDGLGVALSNNDLLLGSHWLQLSHSLDVDEITISFWMKAEELNGGYIMHKMDEHTAGYRGFALVGDSTGLAFWAGGMGGSYWTKCVTGNLNDEWHHVAISAKSKGLQKVYIDGVLCGIGKAGTRGLASAKDLTIGNEEFRGTIDELKIWKRILSDYEVSTEAQLSDKGMWELKIIGDDSPNGIYDPSIAYDSNGVGWMAYSGLDIPRYSHTKLAKTVDNGKTWTYVKTINTSVTAQRGIWRYETPTIVNDTTDTKEPWKIYWHKYLIESPFRPQDRKYEYGWIGYNFAQDPDDEWSKEIPFFGVGPNPIAYDTHTNVSKLHTDLSEITVLSQPDALVINDQLYIAMNGHISAGEATTENIFLIRHNKRENVWDNWEYVSTLLTARDAEVFDADFFTGANLAKEGNRLFLLATPVNTNDKVPYKGTVIIEFTNIDEGILRRDTYGRLLIHKHIKTDLAGGQSAYDEQNTHGGIVMPRIDPSSSKAFKMFNTKQRIVK